MVKKGMSPKKAAMLRVEKGLEETKLQKLRVKRNLSQAELAEISGVTKRTIQHFENEKGAIDNTKLHTLCKLSNTLGCNVVDLLENRALIKLFNKVK